VTCNFCIIASVRSRPAAFVSTGGASGTLLACVQAVSHSTLCSDVLANGWYPPCGGRDTAGAGPAPNQVAKRTSLARSAGCASRRPSEHQEQLAIPYYFKN
jgi:hypothetical protein